jgi:hypothetical protein
LFLRVKGGGFVNVAHVVHFKPLPHDDGILWKAIRVDGQAHFLDEFYSAPGRLERALGLPVTDDRRPTS